MNILRPGRPRFRALVSAIVLTVASSGTAVPLRAQPTISRAWSFCFTSAIGSCSELSLSTTATFDVLGVRTGTLVDVFARHLGGNGIVSGLASFTFFGSSSGGTSDPGAWTQSPAAISGAPVVPIAEWGRWSAMGVVNAALPDDPYSNYLTFFSDFTPGTSQFIGGCLGGSYDADHQSTAVTCGPTAAYRFGFATSAWFDADAVSNLALDVYAPDGNSDFLPDQASCNASIDGTPGAGLDLGDATFTAGCVVGPVQNVVPEPGALLLFLSGALGIAGVRLHRRRGSTTNLNAAMSSNLPMNPTARSMTATAALLVVSLSASLTACDGAERANGPDIDTETSRTVLVDAQLIAAVDDAEARVVPALDAAIRPQVQSALAALHRALDAGELAASRHALAQLQSLVAASAPSADALHTAEVEAANMAERPDKETPITSAAGAADLAAIDMLVRAAQQSLAATQVR